MIIVNCEQGTQEWFDCRYGIPTGSNFDKIITSTGKQSTQAQKYMYKLAGERILGHAEESYKNDAMLRGNELEEEARLFYEIYTGNTVEKVGFCYYDDLKQYGCSPDGLIGDFGCLEIKCPTLPVHVEYLEKGTIPTKYIPQVQGHLYITGRKWCDFLSYYPNLPPLLVRVDRDSAFIAQLNIEITCFCENLHQLTKKIGGK